MDKAEVQGSGFTDQGAMACSRCLPRSLLTLAVAVTVITVWAQWPCVHNGFLNWDDDLYLEEVARHPRLNTETVLWAFRTTLPFYYHPLTFLSHVADHEMWGNNPWGCHLTNVLLHGLNGGLVVLFVWLLLENLRLSTTQRLSVAAGVALAFGLHPLQVEPVAWVAERKTVLCAFFSLLSLCAYLKVVGAGGRALPSTARQGWWWGMIGLFVAALMAKPMALSLPVVLLAMDFYPLQRTMTTGWWSLLKEKALLFALGAVDLVLTVAGQSAMGSVMTIQAQGGAARCLVAARGGVFYLWKLAWPAWLCPFYPLGGTISLREAEFLVPVGLLVAVSALAVMLRRRAPGLLAAWCAYLAMLMPVSGLSQVGSQAVADRFMYLTMLAPLLVIGGGVGLLWRRLRLVGRIGLLLVVCGELLFLAVRTRQQIPVWRNSETLWTNVVDHFPWSGVAQGHLALTLVDQHRLEEALPHAQAALALMPEYPVAHDALASIWSGLAGARVERRQFAEALPYAEQLRQLAPTNATVHAMLGLIYLKTGKPGEAVAELQEALRLNPELPAGRYNLACAYSRTGRLLEAYQALATLLPSQHDFAPLAGRDPELSELRTNVAYRERFQNLIGSVRPPG